MNTIKLKRTLTLMPVVLFGLAYMAPMTVFTTYGVVAQISQGMVPAAYMVALAGMLFTAYSYGQMVKAYPVAGSAYTYSQKAFNPHVGFLVGWVILLDYLFLPMLNYLVAGIYLSAFFPAVPAPVWLICFIVVICYINIKGIKVTTNVNSVLIAYQVLVVAIFVILSIKGIMGGVGTGTLLSSSPIFNVEVPLSLIMAGAAVLCLSFLGFDSVTTLSEETIRPEKNIPRAIFLVALIGGLSFIFVSYIAQNVYPDFASFKDPDSAALEIAYFIGGHFFEAMFLAGMVTACFASGLSSHASVSRLLFAMGRDGVLPKKIFGYVHPKFRTPVNNIVLVGVFALSALFVDLVTTASFINFGALVAFTFVNLSVIAHYFIRGRRRRPVELVKFLLLPLIGSGFTIWLWTSLETNAFFLGLMWTLVGVVLLCVLTKMFTKKPPELSVHDVKHTKTLEG